MRPWAVWATGAALVVVAWGVIHVTPTDDDAVDPFVVTSAVGQHAVARTLEATVTDPRLGNRAEAGGWSADGTWLVVDLSVTGRLGESADRLARAVLVIDGVTYRASERPRSLLDAHLPAGLALAGSLAFELPPDVVDRTAVIELALDDDTRLDSVIRVPLDLASLEVRETVELTTSGWAS